MVDQFIVNLLLAMPII